MKNIEGRKRLIAQLGKFLLILLFGCCLAGTVQARESDESQTPSAEAPLSLRDLLPQSREPLREGPEYSITDKPPSRAARPQANIPAQEPLPGEIPLAERPGREKLEKPALPPEQAEQTAAPGDHLAEALAALPPLSPRSRRGDLSVLEGCWFREVVDCYDQNKIFGWVKYCFDRQGRGTYTRLDEIGAHRGSLYQGGMRAYFDRRGRLIIRRDESNNVNSESPCGEQMVITAVQDNSLSGAFTYADEYCCGFNRLYTTTLRRQKPGNEN
jgi:hypothetical protein